MGQLARFLLAGAGTVGLYVGGVWFGTEAMGLPPRLVNIFFYVLATAISFALNYVWVFASTANKRVALIRYLMLQLFGVALNLTWMEVGLQFTPLWPWVIAALYFVVWPLISFNAQKRFVFPAKDT